MPRPGHGGREELPVRLVRQEEGDAGLRDPRRRRPRPADLPLRGAGLPRRGSGLAVLWRLAAVRGTRAVPGTQSRTGALRGSGRIAGDLGPCRGLCWGPGGRHGSLGSTGGGLDRAGLRLREGPGALPGI